MSATPALRAASACLLALLVPGAGHVFLGRLRKGLVLGAALLALFVLGVALDARLRFYWSLDDVLAVIVGVSQAAAGLPYVLARYLGYEDGHVLSTTFDYGNTFTAVAGLLNALVVLDAYDTAVGRRA